MVAHDPLLQPYRLKHLVLKNRIMSTAHEPAYSEDGMPKDRYRLYHREKAKGGLALTMTAGSAVVAEDSPPAFGNLHAYRDEIVPASALSGEPSTSSRPRASAPCSSTASAGSLRRMVMSGLGVTEGAAFEAAAVVGISWISVRFGTERRV